MSKALKDISFIWLIPTITFIIGVVVFVDYQFQKGPVIELVFDQAEDITPNKTEIKTLNVQVGLIKSVRLSDDAKQIIATAQIDKSAAKLLVKDTLFWMVKPRITKDGVSGLSTLLSGAYINVQRGVDDTPSKHRSFKVLKEPPVAGPDVKGLRVKLVHNTKGKLDVGDPVFYHGYVVGRVETKDLNLSSKEVTYQLFVYAPFDQLIFENTYFWLSKPFDLSLSTSGIHLQADSLENLLLGGVSFDTISQVPPGKTVTQDNTLFRLYDSDKQIQESYYSQFTQVVMFFDGSIRGLHPHSAIEYRGIRVGSVLQAPFNLAHPLSKPEQAIPVLLSIDLGQLSGDAKKVSQQLFTLTQKGLKGVLHPSNLLTGQLMIDLEFDEALKDPVVQLEQFQGYWVVPSESGGAGQLQKQLSGVLESLKKIANPETVAALNKLVAQSSKTVSSVHKLLDSSDMRKMPGAINASLAQINDTLSFFSPDSPSYYDTKQAIYHLDQVLRQLAPLLEQINEKPNALLFNGKQAIDPAQRGYR